MVKASGLAAGKGVVVAANKEEACQAVDEILGSNKFGCAGDTIVIEEKLTGEEISVNIPNSLVIRNRFSQIYFVLSIVASCICRWRDCQGDTTCSRSQAIGRW